MEEFLIFQAGEQPLSADVESVREVVRAATLSSRAGLSKAIEGVLNLRGKAVPVVDLGKLLDLQVPPLSSADYLVVMSDRQNRFCAIRSNSEVHLTSEAEIIEGHDNSDSIRSRMQQLRVGQSIIPLLNPQLILDAVDSTTQPDQELSKDASGDSE